MSESQILSREEYSRSIKKFALSCDQIVKGYEKLLPKWVMDWKIPIAIGGTIGVGLVIYNIGRSCFGFNSKAAEQQIPNDQSDSSSLSPVSATSAAHTVTDQLLPRDENFDSQSSSSTIVTDLPVDINLTSPEIMHGSTSYSVKQAIYNTIRKLDSIMKFNNKVKQFIEDSALENMTKSEIDSKIEECKSNIIQLCGQLTLCLDNPALKVMTKSKMDGQVSQFESSIDQFWNSIIDLQSKKEQAQITLEMYSVIREFGSTVDKVSAYIFSTYQMLEALNSLNDTGSGTTDTTSSAVDSQSQKDVKKDLGSPLENSSSLVDHTEPTGEDTAFFIPFSTSLSSLSSFTAEMTKPIGQSADHNSELG